MDGNRHRRRKGFRRAADLVAPDIRRAAEERGFAETRLLTDWPEVAGAQAAAIARPVKVSWPKRQGAGAVLTLLTTGARAPELQMMLPAIRERVNAAYGYAAVGRIDVTQTAPTGFAEGQARFASAPSAPPRADPADPAARADAAALAAGATDPGLRAALERLGAAIISNTRH